VSEQLYIVSLIPCPVCGEDFPVKLPVGFIEALEREGISEAEQFEAVARGLATRRIACKGCLLRQAN
jgi:hypothetical protein